MKRGKCISLLFVLSLFCFGVGVVTGYRIEEFFYPNGRTEDTPLTLMPRKSTTDSPIIIVDEPLEEVSTQEETVNADTIYVIQERDMDTDTVILKNQKLPLKYIGMNRQQLLDALKDYECNPPLEELERGFVNAELVSFSTARIEVCMNYQYVKPTGSFYIAVYDNHVVVLLDDKKTVFQETQIPVTDLPADVRSALCNGMFVPNEESLYDFLENYTS